MTKEFDINFEPSQAANFLGALAAKLQGDQLLKAIAKGVEAQIQQNFEQEQTPSGTPWKPLAPATIRQRQRKGLVPLKKLKATGRGIKGIRIVIEGQTVKVVVAQSYMDIHNTGGGRIPQRRWLPTEKELSPLIQGVTQAYLAPTLGQFIRSEVARTPDFVKRLLG
jgi:phage gpG-like protein